MSLEQGKADHSERCRNRSEMAFASVAFERAVAVSGGLGWIALHADTSSSRSFRGKQNAFFID